ncbi:hypothetical protein [Paenisporosarcina cavernae]|uniref:DUF4367 domain-containing protein n=1 Tax=Paenisporosarcina cavernae TaxID=2320858 RepID=A0A385YTP6_9BACL|nr:hypothetical protein [Paenisporosarcina cavernae]AYC29881.1 hypothetical protein D3873_08225 [Paenisporosarcina cavernae]
MQKKIAALLFLFAAFVLSGCSASIDEQAENGFQDAKDKMESAPKDPNEKVDDVSFYLPGGFLVQEESDETNIVLKQGQDSYVLFINPNEANDSHLFYDLLQAEKKEVIVAEETFESNGNFGFVAILPSGEDQYEIMVSIGGVKMTTISDKSDVQTSIGTMMEIVRSVEM